MKRLIRSDSNARATKLGLGFECLEQRRVLASWVEAFGGADTEMLWSQQMDSFGNVYLSGTFESQSADFDPSVEGTFLMSSVSAGERSGFAAKYAADGSFVWARRFDYVTSSAFAVESSGEYLYVGGGGFITKLNASTGETFWDKSSPPGVTDLAVADNRVYVTGRFNLTVDFDPGPGTAYLTPVGKGKLLGDAYVLTLESNGNYVSAWKIGGSGEDRGYSLVADGTSLYLLGGVNGSIDLDPGPAVKNATGLFIAKYSASPSPDWVISINNYNTSLAYELNSDADSLYLLTGFLGTVDFDPGVGTATLTSVGSLDAVVAKYSKAGGAYDWAKGFGGLGSEYVRSSIVDPVNGMLYIGGRSWSSTVDFNPGVPGGEMTNNGIGAAGRGQNTSDAFLLKLDADSGTYQQVWQIGGVGYENAARVMGMVGTSVYVAGDFGATVTFPSGQTLTSIGDWDIYLMALDVAPALARTSNGGSSADSNSIDAALLSILYDLDDIATRKRNKRS